MPRDMAQLAKMVVDIATGDAPAEPVSTKNPAAVALGRLGGLKGGRARANALTKKERVRCARDAANRRWGNRAT